MQQLEGGADPGELRDDQTGVGQHQAAHGERGGTEAELLADQRSEPLPVRTPSRTAISWTITRAPATSTMKNSVP
ncbi:hypothetical protein NKH77_40370 [Streptomyces sp. M19]